METETIRITKSAFERSIKGPTFNETVPEFAIAGKSNVGKSSLINMLTHNGKLARTSKQPGKTRLVNYFLINDLFYLVDLPGYGYARVSQAEQTSWGEMMEDYFSSASKLRAVLLLLDIRHSPTAADKAMLYYIEHYAIPYIVVATKADKIAKSKRNNECARLRREIPSSFAYPIIPVSSQEGFGAEEVMRELSFYLSTEKKQ